MSKLALLILLITVNLASFSQCAVNPYIEANYTLDANVLVLRNILSDSSDPDFDNPFIPEERVTRYLEKLSAIYENPNNDPAIDSLFNYFNFHANQEINVLTEFKTISFRVSTDLPWVENFKNTGVSGVPELDNLMATYQFDINYFWDFSSCACTVFFIDTNFDFLNLHALVDDFEIISDIEYAEVYSINQIDYRLNYTGQPYTLSDEYSIPPASYSTDACDIYVSGDAFVFQLYGGDCFSGCLVSEVINVVEVTENCQVLTRPNFQENTFSFYPNPAENYLMITGNFHDARSQLEIFNISGKQVLASNIYKNKKLDISSLKSGLYILQLTQNRHVTRRKLIVK